MVVVSASRPPTTPSESHFASKPGYNVGLRAERCVAKTGNRGLQGLPENNLKQRLEQWQRVPGGRSVDERIGSLQVRIAETLDEIDAALALRYRVFYDEMAARPTPDQRAEQRDFDEFDPYCEHLVVINHELGSGPEAIVGTYRMLRREGAEQVGRFYSADEYDISRLVAQDGDIMEMGRSCIDGPHRTRAAMQLMWRGIAAYIFLNKIDYLFGCASFQGTDPDELALPMSYLAHNHLAPEHFRPIAIPERYVDMRRLAPDQIDAKQAVRNLPPMIRGYLRLGGVIGDGAVIDHEFNTVDVCVVVPIDTLSDRYVKHYLRDMQTDTSD